MVTDNVKNFENLKKVVKFFEHVSTGIMIIVLLLVFLSAFHLLDGIFEINWMKGMSGFFDIFKNFMTTCFGPNIKQNIDGIDGREVLFILVGIVVTYFLSQIKGACNSVYKNLGKKVVEEKERVELEFNNELKQNLINDIMAQKNFVLAIKLNVRWLVKEGVGLKPPTEEELNKEKLTALTKFYEDMKTVSGLKFSKDEDILIISSGDVEHVDDVFNMAWKSITAIRAEFKTRKFGIRMKMIIDSYKPLTSALSVYKKISPLFDLNASNEILCYGNFKNRYELIQDADYYLAVKGKYEMSDSSEETVWSIVKKS